MTTRNPERAPDYITNPLRMRVSPLSGSEKTSLGSVATFGSYADRPLSLEHDLHSATYRLGKGAVEIALHTSPSNSEGKAKVVLMGWGGNVDTGVARLEAAEIEKQNPDTDLVIINNPGSGNSSPLPHSIMKKMKKTGSFMSYGEWLADAVKEVYKDYDRVSISGHSMGARSGIALGAFMDRPIDYITATDPPGSRTLGLLGLAKAFMIKEGGHTGEYAKHTDNSLSLELQRQNDTLHNTLKSIINMGPRAAAQMFFGQTGAMSKDGLRIDLDLLLKSRHLDNGTLQINSPEFSELNRPQDIRSLVADLAPTYPAVDIRHVTLLGQTHSVNTGGNSHTVGLLSSIIE